MNTRLALTDKQQGVYDALNNYIEMHARVPTHTELAKVLGVGRTTVTVHLGTLEDKGYIRRTRRWRDLSVIGEAPVEIVPQWEEATETSDA